MDSHDGFKVKQQRVTSCNQIALSRKSSLL